MFRGFDWLRAFGAAPAVMRESGADLSYAELADRCVAFAGGLGDGRELILLQASNNLETVVAYLAALSAGHVVILTSAADTGAHIRISEAFSPSLIIRDGEITRVYDAGPAELHPDLALLLPTSGSTGRPKLVRLSQGALEANALAIAEYLRIDAGQRAITSLPLHYSYGLSVLNSHLAVGAGIVLTDMSVTDPMFWDLFKNTKATSLAGVPYSYELFERIGLREDPPRLLRTMTQAGGRLSPDLVKTYAEFGAENGVDFFVMYGQTEAGPRMAYLPPDLAAENPDCIGVAIPGGAFELIDEKGKAVSRAGATGELVYSGPNVMMGYAEGRPDLARGADLQKLRTGDLAERTRGGLYRIVGRVSRFAKIAGLRIGLDDLEAVLAERGQAAFVAGSDEILAICIHDADEVSSVTDFVAERCGLPVVRVQVFAAEEPPRLESGKVDYSAIRATGEAKASRKDASGLISAAYADALGIPAPPPTATFASLGGDSLSYVGASVGVERALGHLPMRWEHMTIANLEAMAGGEVRSSSRWRAVNSDVVLRIASIFMIMANHAMVTNGKVIFGGSCILFAMAGYSLGRFQGDTLFRGQVLPPIASSAYRMVLPYLVCWIAVLAIWPHEPSVSVSGLWMASVFDQNKPVPLTAFWMIQTLFHALLVTCLIFLVPPLRNEAKARPFLFMVALTMLSGTFMWFTTAHGHHRVADQYTLNSWLYLYYLGWAAFLAQRLWQKLAVIALGFVLTGLEYSMPSYRELWLTVALTIVLFVPRLRIPAPIYRVVTELATASYFIFLMHVFAFHFLRKYGAVLDTNTERIVVVWVVSVIPGLIFSRVWMYLAPRAWRALEPWLARAMPARLRPA